MTIDASVGPGEATFSPCLRYRYTLTRTIAPTGPVVLWCMLNPSTADALVLDPTIRRCVGFARAWSASRLVVVNLFALRSPNPRDLVGEIDPVGPDNDRAISDAAFSADIVVCAWGGSYPKACRHRPAAVHALLLATGRPIECLGTTNAGEPCHPLYLAAAAPRRPYSRNH